MGICTSCEAISVVPTSTAKLILINGDLTEFDHPIKVSTILEKKSEHFICDIDEMEFDEYATEVGANEEIKLGQIYFVLPRQMLKHRMHADDLAGLAIKASKALTNGRTGKRQLVFGVGSKKEVKIVRKKKGASGRGRDFVTDLSVITE